MFDRVWAALNLLQTRFGCFPSRQFSCFVRLRRCFSVSKLDAKVLNRQLYFKIYVIFKYTNLHFDLIGCKLCTVLKTWPASMKRKKNRDNYCHITVNFTNNLKASSHFESCLHLPYFNVKNTFVISFPIRRNLHPAPKFRQTILAVKY